jgi:hypothetical protein
MFGIFKHPLKRKHVHRKPEEVPPWVRRRLYFSLLHLQEEERYEKELLNLPIKPRLCVVDEERVIMIRPIDRKEIHMDEQMRQAREERKEETQTRNENE